MLITRGIFAELYKQIIIKCQQLNDSFYSMGKKGEGLYGFGRGATFENTIKSIMLESEDVRKVIQDYFSNSRTNTSGNLSKFLNGKYLYDRYRDLENGKKTIELTGLYQYVYFSFIGKKNVEDFINGNEIFSEKEIYIQEALLESDDDGLSKLAVTFHAYYYSIIRHETPMFTLKVDMYKDLLSVEEGFHESSHGATKTKFNGNGRADGNNVFFNLKSDSGIEMSIIIYRGLSDISTERRLRGCFMTVSTFGHPVYGEAIFLNTNILSPDSKEYASYKLSAERELYCDFRNFRIPPRIESSFGDIRVNKTKLELFEPMVGTYVIWSFTNSQSKILQSIFTIENNFSSKLLTLYKNKIKEQVCLLRMAQGTNGDNLFVTAHEKNGLAVRNSTLIETNIRLNHFTKGSFCSVASHPHPNDFNRGGQMVLMKLPKGYSNEYMPTSYEVRLIDIMIKGDENLYQLKSFLMEEFPNILDE